MDELSDRICEARGLVSRGRRAIAVGFVLSASLLPLCAIANPGAGGQGMIERRPPNILVIIADDLGAEQVGAYGLDATSTHTPNIDALARSGVLFRSVWSNPVCSSTRATILTGRYGFRTGVRWVASDGSELHDREYTIPKVLAHHPTARYEMAAFGKWHLHGDDAWSFDSRALSGPVRAGFPYFYGVFHYIVERYDHWRALEVMDLGDGDVLTKHDVFNSNYNTSDTVDRVAAWVRAKEAAHPKRPWFAWLSFNAAHAPYHKPPDALHSVDLGSEDISCENPYPYQKPEIAAPCYRAMVEAMDTEMGRLLDEELSPETRARTVIFFLGDNGTVKEAVVPPRQPMQAKGTPYEGGIHIPLIVAGPGVVGADDGPREIASLVNTVDLFATILEVSGIDVTKSVPASYPMEGEDRGGAEARVTLDGVSFADALRGKSGSHGREFLYAEQLNGQGDPIWPEARAIRDRTGYKLIRFSEQTDIRAHDELYDLRVDPLEQRELLRTPVDGPQLAGPQRDAYRALKARLEAVATGGWHPDGPPFDAPAESAN